MDAAGQKGTGRWTVQTALDLGVPVPTIVAAVNSRIISSYRNERIAASSELTGPSRKFSGDTKNSSIWYAMLCTAPKYVLMLRAWHYYPKPLISTIGICT
ncbi:6-phosphogluconate dehydrogenase,decarboxylating [Richelia intracellularis HM01]|nr:6-phosphogluconate dehydrogenase,decarboxylating [Richelia intracellularis HM01]